MEQQRESEIASGLRSGNADAWRALYDAYSETIWCYVARRLAPHAADVPDVVQETFLAAASSVRSYDPKLGSLLSWLTGIARKNVALYYRKLERLGRVRAAAEKLGVHSQQVMSWLENREPEPADVLQSQEMALMIRATLSGLSDDYGELLAWKYLDDHKVDQIATQLDLTEGAVRSKLARARKAFRQAFAVRFRTDSLAQESNEGPPC